MQIHIDGWSWLKLEDLGEVNAQALKRKLTLVDVVKRSAVVNRVYLEEGGLLAIPRSFFKSSVTKDHDLAFRCSQGLPWPDRVQAPEGVPWASAQDGALDELALVDSVTGEKSMDFFSKDQKTGIGMILNRLCDQRSGDGIAIFASEQSAAKVCLSVIKSFKMRTLVIAPAGASLAMWRTVAGRYLPDAKICVMRRGERDQPDAHITISTVDDVYDFVTRKEVRPDEFGFIITHQIHKIDPIAWSRAVSFFSAAKRLGIGDSSAKFDTGLNRIYRYHLGDPVFCSDPDWATPKVRRVWSSWKISMWAKVNPQFVSKDTLLSNMVTSTVYNTQLVEQVIQALKVGRKVMIFSERVPHLKTLKLQIETEWSGELKIVDYAIDGMSPDEIAKSSECDVILTTYSFVKSLPEIPTLDTIVLGTPVQNPLPYAKLCQIKDPNKKAPVIVDMRCDEIPICKEYAKLRDDIYRQSFGTDST